MVQPRKLSDVAISKKIGEMKAEMNGFWAHDRWDVRKCPHPSAIEFAKRPALKNRWVNFEQISNPWLRTELKYFFYYHLLNDLWQAVTVWQVKGTAISKLVKFINHQYSDIHSITQVSLQSALTQYRTFLVGIGGRITTTNYKITSSQEIVPIKANSYYVTLLKQFIEFYGDFYFDGEEWEKDIWDRRKLNLPADKVNPTQYEYIINFKGIPNKKFRELVKRYCKLRLNINSFASTNDIAHNLKEFFIFLNKKNPHITSTSEITRRVIEDYISELNQSALHPSTVTNKISAMDQLFQTMSRHEWNEAPSKMLVYSEDYPKIPKATPRFIDDFVLQQLNQNLDKLPDYIAKMTIIIQECGMRISELCTLKKDCLIQDREGDYFLKYYQWKMKKEHVVPISREVAALITAQHVYIGEQFGEKTEYLFPGRNNTPLKQATFRLELNKLAVSENIVDRSGKIFRFQAHAFRHTVGTKMINNGVPQHIVQKFLGHESPEMTSRYAHIFDETLKNEFVKFKETLFTKDGEMIHKNEEKGIDNNDLQWLKKNINAQVLPNGYCRLPVVAGPCPHANACLDCTHFCTSKKFLKEHENHLERTGELLKVAQERQWQRQIETNLRVKERLEHIIKVIRE